MSTPSALVQKLWNYCNILRDDGLSFHLRRGFGGQDGDYVEQLTFLLFLKMADEAFARGHQKPPFNTPSQQGFGGAGKPSSIPKGFGWDSLLKREAVFSGKLQRASSLRQSILQKAFTGELV